MVYAIEKVMKEEFDKQYEEGKLEGIVKEAENTRQKFITSAEKLLAKKFGTLSHETTQKLEAAKSEDLIRILSNILDIESLDEALKIPG